MVQVSSMFGLHDPSFAALSQTLQNHSGYSLHVDFAQSCLKSCRHSTRVVRWECGCQAKVKNTTKGCRNTVGYNWTTQQKGKPRHAEKTTARTQLLYGMKRRATPALVGFGNACWCTVTLKHQNRSFWVTYGMNMTFACNDSVDVEDPSACCKRSFRLPGREWDLRK